MSEDKDLFMVHTTAEDIKDAANKIYNFMNEDLKKANDVSEEARMNLKACQLLAIGYIFGQALQKLSPVAVATVTQAVQDLLLSQQPEAPKKPSNPNVN